MSQFEFCLPTSAKVVQAGPEWFHEIKYDGYRLRLERDGDRVRLITKGGYDWTKRTETAYVGDDSCPSFSTIPSTGVKKQKTSEPKPMGVPLRSTGICCRG